MFFTEREIIPKESGEIVENGYLLGVKEMVDSEVEEGLSEDCCLFVTKYMKFDFIPKTMGNYPSPWRSK